jgi:peptidoglycan/LPS O-acetylase OafA/YrhL
MDSYRREIDGLRAFAVLPVILFHAGFQLFSGGFVGVDVFFVISGYLITTIILSELESGRFSIIRFYERRARRLLPALFFVMLVSLPFAWLFLMPSELTSFSRSITAVSLFVSNFFFWRDGSYFETAAELKPLLHTWSLAVEEQYYVIFPLFLMTLWRFGKRFIVWTVSIAAIISLAFAQAGSVLRPVPTFFMLPTRAWEVAIGALVAFQLARRDLRVPALRYRQGAALLGFMMLLASIATFDSHTPFPSVYTILPTLGTALMILYARPDTHIGKLLGWKVFVGIGLISYSAYLWHQPLFAFTRYSVPSLTAGMKICLIALVFVLSVISWKGVERPFRQEGTFSRTSVFVLSAVGTAFFIAVGYSSSKVDFSDEPGVARQLTSSSAIYTWDMNERTFIKSRIEYETLRPGAIVLGSSRTMQIGKHVYPGEILNLCVSGASIEDDVAIGSSALRKFNPDTILIAADPWLFNANSGQHRWKSLRSEYYLALSDLGITAPGTTSSGTATSPRDAASAASKFYRSVNRAKVRAEDDSPSVRDKIRRDGSLVYNLFRSGKSPSEVERNAISSVSYAMSSYVYSKDAQYVLEKFISASSKHHKVVLVLAPYHPKLFEFMKNHRREFLDIEKQFRDLSYRLGVHIVGSYDPSRVGCKSEEFYDGMHPKDSCMKKVLSQLL